MVSVTRLRAALLSAVSFLAGAVLVLPVIGQGLGVFDSIQIDSVAVDALDVRGGSCWGLISSRIMAGSRADGDLLQRDNLPAAARVVSTLVPRNWHTHPLLVFSTGERATRQRATRQREVAMMETLMVAMACCLAFLFFVLSDLALTVLTCAAALRHRIHRDKP